jgi:F-type H+-transporting ATPase subunit delta
MIIPNRRATDMAVSANVYSKLVSSYAKALFDAVLESNKLDAVAADFVKLEKMFDGAHSRDFKDLNSPMLPEFEKAKIIEEAVKGKINDELFSFLIILVKNKRLKYLFDIKEAFLIMIDKHNNVIRGTISIAQAPDDESRNVILDSLSGITKKKIIVDFVESPELIAGFKTFLGSYYIDYSLSSHLDKLENELKRSS